MGQGTGTAVKNLQGIKCRNKFLHKIPISAKYQMLKKPFHAVSSSVSLPYIFDLSTHSFCTVSFSPEVCRKLSKLMLVQFVLHNFAGWKKKDLYLSWHIQCNHSHVSCPAVPSLKTHCLSIIVDFHLGKISLLQCDFHGFYFKYNYLFYSYKI